MADPFPIPGSILPIVFHIERKAGFEIEYPRRGIFYKYNGDIIGPVVQEIARYPALPFYDPLFQAAPIRRYIEQAVPSHPEYVDTYYQVFLAGAFRKGPIVPKLEFHQQRRPDIDDLQSR